MKLLDIDFGRWASILFCLAALALGGYLGLRYLFPVALPFLLAWGLALLLRPFNFMVHKRFHLPGRLVAALTVTLSLTVLFFAVYGIASRLVRELQAAVSYLTADPSPLKGIFAWLSPEGEALVTGVEAYTEALVGHIAEALLAAIPPLLGSAVLSLPSAVLFLLVSIVASFYFSMDLDRVHAAVRDLLPARIGRGLGRVREEAFRMGLGYLRSYLILTGVIFLVMLVGLSLLGVDYALLLSLVLAAVDILPVVGVGTVLVPWGILSLAMGQTGQGIGLILLFAVSEVVRQVLEPRLLGSALGLHPLLSLLSLYLGARLFGFFGLVFGPLLAVVLSIVAARIRAHKTKNPSYDGVSVGQARSTLPERRQREQT